MGQAASCHMAVTQRECQLAEWHPSEVGSADSTAVPHAGSPRGCAAETDKATCSPSCTHLKRAHALGGTVCVGELDEGHHQLLPHMLLAVLDHKPQVLQEMGARQVTYALLG